MNKILCQLGFHLWKYPLKCDGFRKCEICELEQSQPMFWDTWFTDFWSERVGKQDYK